MRPRLNAPFGALAVAFASCALLAAGAAYAETNRVENTNRVELVIGANLRADVMWASVEDGQNVFLWIDNRSASQLFDLINVGGGFFQIRARHSGKCLMLETGRDRVGNGTRIAQYPCKGAGYKSEQWSFIPMEGCADNALCINTGRHIVRNRYTGKCLDTDNPSGRKPGRQAVLQLWTCISSHRAWNADNQIWKIIDADTKRPVRELR
jgi:Ricin-type beta-trefoil lectin domain-like